jgi:predicted transcriptional regulator
MSTVKISSMVDEEVWEELRKLVAESNQTISGALTDAIADYVKRRRVRPAVLAHLEDSMDDNEELGRLLAQ